MGLFRKKPAKVVVRPLNYLGVSKITEPEKEELAFKTAPAAKKTTVAKKKVATRKATTKSKPIKNAAKTATGATKDVMVERNASRKWAVRTAGSSKALKVFDTQKEAAEYGKIMAKRNGSELRIKGKDGAVKAKTTHRK